MSDTGPDVLLAISDLAPWIAERRLRSAVVLTGPSRRFVDRLEAALDGVDVALEIVDRAEVHVPATSVAAAAKVVDRARPDLLISLGGGAATGLGKALRIDRELAFAAIPTTYSASEMTAIVGVLVDGTKQVSRDERARPDVVVHDVDLTLEMPVALGAASLLNALAHPIGALSAGASIGAGADAGDDVGSVIAAVTDALLRVLATPRSPRARRAALDAVAAAGRVLDSAELGAHHRVAHVLGGRFAAPHAGVHSVVLPHSVAALDGEAAEAVATAAAVADLPATLHDALVRAGAPSRLRDLGVDGAALRELIDEGAVPEWVWHAYLGIRPSRGRRVISGDLWAGGAPLDAADRAVVAVHDRDGDAGAAIDEVRILVGDDPGVAILAPQAPSASSDRDLWLAWRDPISAAVEHAVAAVGRDRVSLVGIGRSGDPAIELARRDPRLAPVTLGDAATGEIGARDRLAARAALLGEATPAGERGFGNSHEVELLPGALPRDQNSPRRVAYGLWAEQINGTGFVARRGENLRSWLYRIRPATGHTDLVPIAHDRITGDFDGVPVDPNLAAWAPAPIPEAPTDFVDGLVTLGGAGRADLRRGYAVHVYAANRSMEHRAFANADGDLLIIPQSGAITALTELGALEVAPGSVALLPRGVRFSILVDGAGARGWVGEIFGRHFELPDRGPVGANGLTDPRHFVTPAPYFEDRLDPGYRITTKISGRLWDATADYSPYDVVAWHGNYTPYRYDLRSFSPVGNTRFDHADPSIFTVLSAPLDERGASTLDFVFFPPRWDPTEHTFRPPFFHRNATMEINGVIADPGLSDSSPFSPGCTFITPTLTAHGVLSRSVEAALAAGDRPVRISDRSMWFQFESALPMALTEWAAASRVDQWRGEWGAHRTHYDPRAR